MKKKDQNPKPILPWQFFANIEIVIGTLHSREEFEEAAEKAHCIIDSFWLETLNQPPQAPTPKESKAKIVFPTVKELGFNKPPLLADLFAKAFHVGLWTCSVEMAVQFCLQYPTWAHECQIKIATRPFGDRHLGRNQLPEIVCEGTKHRLISTNGSSYPDSLCLLDGRWAFTPLD